MLDQDALNTLFHKARSHNGWQNKPVSDNQLKALYELTKWGPTSANCSPARIAFVKSTVQKEKLAECVMPGNVDKVLTAPVVAIIGMDLAFPETLSKLFPHTDARSWFVGNQPLIEGTAFRNSSLQGRGLFHPCSTRAGARLRADVGLRCR